ncbi:TPA: AmmeMemoRadiSam system radical SAM enzyme [bacterium]|nr:AmmeMemoRadiSam system radical SAM enzyme [bacterium]
MIKKIALFWEKEDEAVVCLTCEKRCGILPGKTGFCKTRENIDGKLYTLIYGEISSISVNPIEKKPFFHFYPGTKALTIGSWSCNFNCPWCQNYGISKYPQNIGKGEYLSPERFIELMVIHNCQGTSISFNEPTLLLEYSIDIFRLAKQRGYYNTFVTNGYMTTESLKALKDAGLDAMNIDVKGDKGVVKEYCGADVEKVWQNAIESKKYGIWIELTTLIIPDINDTKEQIGEIAQRIKKELGDETPWHVTGYYPAYKFDTSPTTSRQLESARNIGIEKGLKYVYVGNVPGNKYENTYCPKCSQLLIERFGFDIIENKLKASKDKCPNCRYKINIIL